MLKGDKISPAEFFNNYKDISIIMEDKKQHGKETRGIASSKKRINYILENSGVTDCHAIVQAFSGYENDAQPDIAVLSAISSLLQESGCDTSTLYADLNKKILLNDQNPDRYYELSKYYIRKEAYGEAVKNLGKAAELETDNVKKAQYLYQMAVISDSKLNDPKSAVNYSQQALKIRPGWGEPCFTMASAYINGMRQCTDDPFLRSTAYWIAVDQCELAKTIEPTLAARANALIQDYKRYFPSKEDIFFRSMKEGSSYTPEINCWINVSTHIRAK